jgi:hypothetical protein
MHSIAIRIFGIKLNQQAITHTLSEAEFDTLTMEHIATISGNVRPYRGHIPTIEPDLYVFDRSKNLHAVTPGISPLVHDHREKGHEDTPNEDSAKGDKRQIHSITFHYFPV